MPPSRIAELRLKLILANSCHKTPNILAKIAGSTRVLKREGLLNTFPFRVITCHQYSSSIDVQNSSLGIHKTKTATYFHWNKQPKFLI